MSSNAGFLYIQHMNTLMNTMQRKWHSLGILCWSELQMVLNSIYSLQPCIQIMIIPKGFLDELLWDFAQSKKNEHECFNKLHDESNKRGYNLRTPGYVLQCTTEQMQGLQAFLCKMNGHYCPQHKILTVNTQMSTRKLSNWNYMNTIRALFHRTERTRSKTA